jgi:hypothetical protein
VVIFDNNVSSLVFLFRGTYTGSEKPYNIGEILKISGDKQHEIAKIVIRKFFRPFETSLRKEEARFSPLNELFWSDETKLINSSQIVSKCQVFRLKDPSYLIDHWMEYPYVFYFERGYSQKLKQVSKNMFLTKLIIFLSFLIFMVMLEHLFFKNQN